MNQDLLIKAITDNLSTRWLGKQVILVLAEEENEPKALMWLLDRSDDQWHAAQGPWPAVVGKNGVGKRREGDGKSPSGAFLLCAAFGRKESPSGMRWPYRRLDSLDRWVENTASPLYNRWARCPALVCGEAEDLEAMRYDHAAAVRWNCAGVPGRGSAIFLHAWRAPGQGTAGCTAVSEENITKLIQWLEYDKRPVLVQGTRKQLESLMAAEWGMICLPAGWGLIDDLIPDAQLDMRYSTASNFTGCVLPGYLAPLAPMRLEAIRALAGAADELRAKGLGIRVYDAYRPQRATDAMIAWAEDECDTVTKPDYYPELEKREIPNGFVARRSAHRLGGTIDLTLLNWQTGENLDMGGPFDFFGDRSAFGFVGLTAVQAANRTLLRDVMMRHGYQPYEKEWWHFSFPVQGDGEENFPILPAELPV